MARRKIIGERNSFTDSTLESSFRDYGIPNSHMNGHFRDRNSYKEDENGNIILSEELDENGRRQDSEEEDYD